jgi:hypothetical protein
LDYIYKAINSLHPSARDSASVCKLKAYDYFRSLVLPVYLQVKALILALLGTWSWSGHDNEEEATPLPRNETKIGHPA